MMIVVERIIDWYYTYDINAEDTFSIPFFVPLSFWLSCYIYCYIINTMKSNDTTNTKLQFHKWYTIHNIHNFGAIILGSISIYSGYVNRMNTTTTTTSSNNHTIHYPIIHFNERIPILWSLSYFSIDIIDCCIRYDISYLFHALCCFILGYMNYTTPILRLLHMNSKASFCELSNPFMHLAKRTRQPIHFIMFALIYTLCRILWIPIMYYQLISYTPSSSISLSSQQQQQSISNTSSSIVSSIPWYHPICCVLIAFYGLNLYWYIKIINILISGGSKSNNNIKGTTNESNQSKNEESDVKKNK